ncbi:hypothetical protein EXN66_Car008096 [Channa argus]|uniref:Uncharacterized protein n=1 Tax=Channa argus TaxID=215402 RepID=A0A6G1PQ42_CHAAH|nr:hypothetical protein EXN66_Car008096 [Channa argus]
MLTAHKPDPVAQLMQTGDQQEKLHPSRNPPILKPKHTDDRKTTNAHNLSVLLSN